MWLVTYICPTDQTRISKGAGAITCIPNVYLSAWHIGDTEFFNSKSALEKNYKESCQIQQLLLLLISYISMFHHNKWINIDVFVLRCFSCVHLFVTLWTVACQAPLSMGFSR